MRFKFLAIMCLIWIAMSYGSICLADVGEETDNGTNIDVPQDFVVCTGWHALCTASPDCIMNGDKADCDCMRVNETNIVATSEIQDTEIKNLTQAKCTNEHPCDVDQAPIAAPSRMDHMKQMELSTIGYRPILIAVGAVF